MEPRPSAVTFTPDDEAEREAREGQLVKIVRDGAAIRHLSTLFNEGVGVHPAAAMAAFPSLQEPAQPEGMTNRQGCQDETISTVGGCVQLSQIEMPTSMI